jgi:DNA-binding MarR family transcriptional regulator
MDGLDFGIALGLAYQTFTDELRETLARQGFEDLGRWYGYVFRALDAEDIRLTTLAARLGMSNQGAAKIVDEMAARGYLARETDPQDGRGKVLRLTVRGRRALATARRFHAEFERRLKRRLGAPAVENLRGALADILHAAGGGPTTTLRPG